MDNTSFALYDRKGIPIMPGDTIKIYSYTAALRREKVYLYKYVEAIEMRKNCKFALLRINHLSRDGKTYHMLMTGEIDETCEIVQGFEGVPLGCNFKDRQRLNT